MSLKNLYFILLFLLISCSRGVVSINTLPVGATIQAIQSDGAIKKIGITPIDLELRDIFDGGKQFVRLSVTKDGFYDENIVLNRPYLESNIKVNLEFEPLPVSNTSATEQHEEIARGIANAQRLINSRKFESAAIALKGMMSSYPRISVIYDLLGNLYYMQKDLREALTYYEKAIEIDPSVEERKRIVQKIKVILGTDQNSGDRL